MLRYTWSGKLHENTTSAQSVKWSTLEAHLLSSPKIISAFRSNDMFRLRYPRSSITKKLIIHPETGSTNSTNIRKSNDYCYTYDKNSLHKMKIPLRNFSAAGLIYMPKRPKVLFQIVPRHRKSPP